MSMSPDSLCIKQGVRIKRQNFCLIANREMHRLAGYDRNETQECGTIRQTFQPFAFIQLQNAENIYKNINNNGNFTNSTPRTCDISAGVSNCTIIQTDGCRSLRQKTHELKKQVPIADKDVLIFDGRKVYSINRKTMRSNELMDNVVCDINDNKDQRVDTGRFFDKISTDLRIHRNGAAVNMAETMIIENMEEVKSAGIQNITRISQTTDSEIFNTDKRPCIAESLLGEMAQRDWNKRIDVDNNDTNQVRAKTKPNIEMLLNLDTVDSSKDGTKYELHSRRLGLTKEQRSEMEGIRTRRSENEVNLSRKSEICNEWCLNNSQSTLLKHSLLEDESQVSKVTQQGQCLASSRRRKKIGGKTRRQKISADDKWATATGKSDTNEVKRLSEISKIEHLRKNDFPMLVRPLVNLDEKDRHYLPERTRRLTIESPAENLLVHTSYIRPNPHQPKLGDNLGVVSHKSKLYLGQEDDVINTSGTRRLICETECFSSKDPKTHNLVIENGKPIVCQEETNTASEKEHKKITLNAVEDKKLALTGTEVAEVRSNKISDECLMRFGTSCIRMIGDYVVIGTGTNMSSILKMVQNQKIEAITASDDAGVNNSPVCLAEAGDGLGDNPQKRIAIRDCRRVGGSGDNLMAANELGNSNNSNNNISMQDKLAGVQRGRLSKKTSQYVHNENYNMDAVAFDRVFCADKKCLLDSSRMYNAIDFCGMSCDTILVYRTNSFRLMSMDVNINMTSVDTKNQCGNLVKGFELYGLYILSWNIETSESNRNNSSAPEGSDLPGLDSNILLEMSATGNSDCLKPSCQLWKCHENTETRPLLSGCSIPDQMTLNNTDMISNNFTSQVNATDINPTAGTQTWEYIKLLEVKQDSSIKEPSFDESIKALLGHCCSREFISRDLNVEATREVETQVEATQINPSKITQTENARVPINRFFRSNSELTDNTSEDSGNTLGDLLPHLHAQSTDVYGKPYKEIAPCFSDSFVWYPKEHHSQKTPHTVTVRNQSTNFQHRDLENVEEQGGRNEDFADVMVSTDRDEQRMQEAKMLRPDSIMMAPEAVNYIKNDHLAGSLRTGPKDSTVASLPMNPQDIYKTQLHEDYMTDPTDNFVNYKEELYRDVPTNEASVEVTDPPPLYGNAAFKERLSRPYKNRLLQGNTIEETVEDKIEETIDEKGTEEIVNVKVEDAKTKRHHVPYRRRHHPNTGPSVSTQTECNTSHHRLQHH